MKKIIVIFIVFSTLLLSACGNQLDEKAGTFGNFDLTPADPSDVHYFIYDFATNHDPYSIYPNSEYHYYYCADSLYGGGCTLEAGFEPHTKKLSSFSGKPVMLYNGHYYHVAKFECVVCGSIAAGSEYVLCSDNSKTCAGKCANVTHYREVTP